MSNGEVGGNHTLGLALKQYYRMKNIGVRQLAVSWKCSPATVSRLLNGRPVEMRTFLRLLEYLLMEVNDGQR